MASVRYVLRNLDRRRTRSILGALGVCLTLAFLTAIQIGLDSVSSSYIDLVALQAGKADVVITAPEGTALEAEAFDPAEVLKRASQIPELAGLSPRLLGVVRASQGMQTRFVFLIGIDPERERELDISGLTPEPDLRPGRCALSETLAEKLGAGPGDSVDLAGAEGGTPRTLELGTIVERQLVVPQEVRDYVVVDEQAAREILGEATKVHRLAGAFHDPRSYYDARDLHASITALKDAGEEIAKILGADYSVALPKAAAITAFQRFTSPLRAIFGVFTLLALVITGLLVYSLVSVAVEERIREYAILRTLGAKRRGIFGLVLIESTLLCLVGVVPGVLLGALFAQGVVNIVELSMGAEGDPISLAISSQTLWITLAAGVLLSIGSALIPAFRAIRWNIVDALDPMRQGQVPTTATPGDSNRGLLLTGLALSALSVVVFFVLPSAFLSGDPSLIGTVVLGLLLTILLGFTLVAVGALPWTERVMLVLTGWVYGPAAELAGRNLVRHRRRNTTTALMFTLSVCLVLFVASLVALFSKTSLVLFEQQNGADVRVQTSDPQAGELREELVAMTGVEAVSEARWLQGRSPQGIAYDVVIRDLVGMNQVWITLIGVDPELAQATYAERAVYRTGDADALAELALDTASAMESMSASEPQTPPIVLSVAIADSLEVTTGDVVQLSFRLGSERRDARFRVVAVCGSFPGFPQFRTRVANRTGAGVLVSMAAFEEATAVAPRAAFHSTLFLKTRESGEDVAREIRESFGVRYRFGVESTAEQKRNARTLYWATQVFFGLLLVVAVVIAVFALIASMSTAVIERRREIGILKSLGLRRRQLFRMFLAEAVTLTLSSGLAGGAIGFALAWLFALQAAALIEMPLVFTMPYLTFIATLGIAIVAGTVAASIPTRRILRRPAAEILRAGD